MRPAIVQNQHLLFEVLNQKFFRQLILMAAGNVRVADLLDTVHHDMDRVVCSHHVSKSVWSPEIGERLILEKEPAGQSTQ